MLNNGTKDNVTCNHFKDITNSCNSQNIFVSIYYELCTCMNKYIHMHRETYADIQVFNKIYKLQSILFKNKQKVRTITSPLEYLKEIK